MKKYKLVKTYPGSPELNTILKEWVGKDNSNKRLYGKDNTLSPGLEPNIVKIL